MRLPLAIEHELEARRKAVDDARRHALLLEAELRGFEAAAVILTQSAPLVEEADNPGAEQRVRGTWRAILAAIAPEYPKLTTLDKFEQIANRLGTPTTRNTLRSQMSNYAHLGFVERVGQGAYRLTLKGAEMLGVTLGRPGIAPEPHLVAMDAAKGSYSIADDDGRIEEEGQHKELQEDAMYSARASPLL